MLESAVARTFARPSRNAKIISRHSGLRIGRETCSDRRTTEHPRDSRPHAALVGFRRNARERRQRRTRKRPGNRVVAGQTRNARSDQEVLRIECRQGGGRPLVVLIGLTFAFYAAARRHHLRREEEASASECSLTRKRQSVPIHPAESARQIPSRRRAERLTGYPAEACYLDEGWQTVKADPTWVLVSSVWLGEEGPDVLSRIAADWSSDTIPRATRGATRAAH
jgi:hypothetical protein